MSERAGSLNRVERYERYMEVVRARATSREFDGSYVVPREHYEMIIEAARHAITTIRPGAAALGYAVWWVTAVGQEEAQRALRPLLDVPDELSLIDIMCFGPPRRPPYKRWKKRSDEIMSWNRYDRAKFLTRAQIDEWIEKDRARVMFRDESRTD